MLNKLEYRFTDEYLKPDYQSHNNATQTVCKKLMILLYVPSYIPEILTDRFLDVSSVQV